MADVFFVQKRLWILLFDLILSCFSPIKARLDPDIREWARGSFCPVTWQYSLLSIAPSICEHQTYLLWFHAVSRCHDLQPKHIQVSEHRTGHSRHHAVTFKHYSDVIMSAVAFKSMASRLLVQPFGQAQIKENIKAPRHWPLWGEFTGYRWIPRTKGQ